MCVVLCSLHIVSLFSWELWQMLKFCTMWFLLFGCWLLVTVYVYTQSQPERWMQSHIFHKWPSHLYACASHFLSLSLFLCLKMHFHAVIYHFVHEIVCTFLHLSFINFSLHDMISPGKFGEQQRCCTTIKSTNQK